MSNESKKKLDNLIHKVDDLFNSLQEITREELETLSASADVDNNNVRFHQLWKVFDDNVAFSEKFEKEFLGYIESIKDI